MFRLSLSAKVAFAQLAQMIVFSAAMVFILGSTASLFDKTSLISEQLEPAVEKLSRINDQIGSVLALLESGQHEDLRRADRMLVRYRPFRQLRTVVGEDLRRLAESTEIEGDTRARINDAIAALKSPGPNGAAAPLDAEAGIDAIRVRMTASMQDPVVSRPVATELAERLKVVRKPLELAARGCANAGRQAEHELASHRSSLWTTILAVAAGTLVLSVLFLVLAIASTRPISEITLAIRRLAAGDLSHVKIKSSRELEETADAINQLATAFRAQQAAGAVEKEREIRTERLAVVGRMASAVAHEIRNPLNSISLNIDLLADMLESPEKYGNRSRDVINAVQREVDRLNEITEDYLQFGRMPKAMIGPCNVAGVVRETCDFMASEFSERGVSLTINSFDETARVLSDEGQLRQALVNILRNSCEAMPDGGTLVIDIKPSAGETIELSVRDSGQGIPAAQMARLFEPFATTKRGGTGLGLAFVQQVVTESGGRVQVDSQEGRGTTVRITLNRSAS